MIAVKDMAYVRYQAPDLDAMERCLLDFGLHRVRRSDDALHMRSHGSAPFVHVTQRGPAASIGFGLIAGSADDLRRLAAETGTRVEPSDEPGGGLRVTLTDPAGLRVDVVHGQVAARRRCRCARRCSATCRARRHASIARCAPSRAHRRCCAPAMWRCSCPTSTPPTTSTRVCSACVCPTATRPGRMNRLVAAFLHCGLGDTPVDHHTVALVSPPGLPSGRIDHSAFEVTDLDDLMRGHEHLRARGHKHSWGRGPPCRRQPALRLLARPLRPQDRTLDRRRHGQRQLRAAPRTDGPGPAGAMGTTDQRRVL